MTKYGLNYVTIDRAARRVPDIYVGIMQEEGIFMYYYAVMDEKNIVINVISSQTEMTGSNIVSITQSQYNDPDSILGMYYDVDSNSFIIPPISVLAETSTSNIQYKSEEKWLDEKLDEIESSIENIELTPGPQGATGATGESGATFTPSVSSSGDLSWTNNKGLTNPATVNIKGPKGDTGATGPQGPAGTNAASAFEGYTPSQFATSGHTHSNATSSSSGFMSGTDKSAFDTAKNRGQIGNAKNITVSGEDLDDYIYPGVYTFATSYTPSHIPAGNNGWLVVLRWPTSDASATVKQLWFRHGTAGTNDFETYVRTKLGSNAFGSWSKFYTTSNPPTAAEVGAMSKSLQPTSDVGSTEFTMTSGDLYDKIHSLGLGFHTIYCSTAVSNIPSTREAWRILVHKTNKDSSHSIAWVLAFGSSGSVYTNYEYNANSFYSWKCIYEVAPGRLWNGAKLVKANETITPSKKLSECRTGWMLLWSDYDPDTSSGVDADFVTTFIPNRSHSGGTWNGSTFFADIPRFIGSNTQDSSTEKRIMKWFTVYDDRIVGEAANEKSDRNDVALRAIYEF